MNLQARKQTARRLAHARRSALSLEQRAQLGAAIAAQVMQLPEMQTAGTVLGYVSIGAEVPTESVLAQVLEHRRLLLPYVADDGAMRATPVSSLDELAPGYRRIPEPRNRLPVEVESADLILVPGVAFDRRGARLGYGGGYYDRLLEFAPGPVRAGLAFGVQLIDAVPTAPHDQRVDIVVTEAEVVRAEPRSRGTI